MADFYNKIQSGYYSDAGEYPSKPKRPRLPDSGGTAEDFRNYADQLDSYETGIAEWRTRADAYNRRSRELEQEFQRDLEDHHGMTGHPKAAILFGKAWDRGHSAGYYDVALVYDDLVDLVK